MPSKTDFDVEIEGERFIELNLKIHTLISSVFGSPENCPAQIQLKYFDTLEEIVRLVPIPVYYWRDQVGRSLHQCNILADKLVDLLGKLRLEGNEHHDWGTKYGLQRKKDVAEIFVEMNAEIDAIMLDLGKIEPVTLLPRADYAMKNPMFTIASAKIIRNPFAADPAAHRDAIKTTKGETVQETWDWVLQTPEFIKWRTSDDHFLWISGGIGSGKTMLAVYLTEQLQLTMASDEILLDYFFDARLELRNNAACLVRSLIYQLVQLEKDGKHGNQWYNTRFQSLWDKFIDILQDLKDSRVICILDGLDECEARSLELLLTKLKLDIPGLPIKFVILSRVTPGALEDLMSQYPRVNLDASFRVDALGQYISASPSALQEVEQLPTDFHSRVKELLQGRSGASYLWTHLALQSLQHVKASDTVNHLENLPQGLEDLYEWQLSQIDTDQREFALEALKWCVLSERPMELSQLAEVLPVQAKGSLTPEDFLRSRLKHCGILIKVSKHPRRFTFLDWSNKARTIIHGEYETVAIVHRSVCDFLTRVSSPSRWYSLHKTPATHLDMAIKCLNSINAADVRDVVPETSNGFSSFRHYASECWSYHFGRTGELAVKLVNNHPEYFNESPWLNEWFLSLGITKDSVHWRLCLAAAALGLDDLVEHILEHERPKLRLLRIPMPHSITMKMLGTTPLHLAAQNGHLSTTKMLLGRISINTMDSKHYTSMFLAGMKGHVEVTELLLQAGADITSQHPLLRAIWAHDEGMVKLLLGWSPPIGMGTLQSATRVPIWLDGERDSMVALLLSVYARQEAKTAILAKDSCTLSWVRQLRQSRTRPREWDHIRFIFDTAVYTTTSLKTMKALLELTGPPDMNSGRNEFYLSRARIHGNRAEVIQMLTNDYGYSISDADDKR
ncbi:ankyrin repeat [Fusarium phyllophilum]|uniref:Ankyrin repeat n=1 Tax=Fusarium phyllophilum TaxID=47803 RepID=A0A8H5NM74_9HYPO|nr:ankyrin repeat [Fusarium phyllophilum]